MKNGTFSIPLAIGFAMLFGDKWAIVLVGLINLFIFAYFYGEYMMYKNYPKKKS